MVPLSPSAVKIIWSWMTRIMASLMLIQEKKKDHCPPGVIGTGLAERCCYFWGALCSVNR